MANFNKLKIGNKLSEIQYYSVEKIVGDKIQLKPDSGDSIVVNKDYVDKFLTSADQWEKEEKVTKTVATEIFKSNPGVVMTCSYQKQVKEADVLVEIKEAYENSTPKEIEVKLKKAIKTALNGVERVIVGRHNGAQDDFGRFHFTDMEIAQDTSKSYDVRQRLVDPRTISYLIVKGVKYTVK